MKEITAKNDEKIYFDMQSQILFMYRLFLFSRIRLIFIK